MIYATRARRQYSSSGCTIPLFCLILATKGACRGTKVMDGEYGGSASGELQAIFDAVASASAVDIDGDTVDKYTPRVLGNLVWSIETRSYGQDMLRLCHLLRVAACCRAAGGYVEVLYPIDPVRPGVLRSLVQPYRSNMSQAGIEDAHDCITISYADGSFELSHAGMSDLIALFEFLVMVLGFNFFDETAANLSGPNVTNVAVAGEANRLQKTIYAWLLEHLPPVQVQRKGRVLNRFLMETCGEDFSADDLGDEVILSFWLRYSGNTEMDFRMYRSVYAAFRRLRADMADDIAATQFRRAMSSFRGRGQGGDAEDIDIVERLHAAPSSEALPDEDRAWRTEFEVLVGTTIEEPSALGPIDRLASDDLSSVKFLTAKDRELVRDLVDDPLAVVELPFSTLRLESFGRGQNLLKEGKGGGENRVREALERATSRAYQDLLEAFEKVHQRLKLAMDASYYVLSQARPSAGEDRVVRPNFDILPRARKAFERIERAGFRRADLENEQMLEVHRMSAGELHLVAEALERIVRTWKRHLDPSKEDVFEGDRVVFYEQFQILYGEEL